MGLLAAATLVSARPGLTVAWVAPGSVLPFLAYVAGTRATYRNSLRGGLVVAESLGPGRPPQAARTVRGAVTGFLAVAAVMLAAGPAFAWSAKDLAEITGLGHTFVGTWLVGLATSLPEFVACWAAVRIGAFDLAVGNLLGSNAFNMAIFLALDLAQPGSLFAALHPSHAVSGLFAVILTSLGLASIVYRAEKRFAMIEPDSLLMLVTYGVGLLLLYPLTAAP